MRWTYVGATHSDQYKKYNNKGSNSNDSNNNKCKNVYECLAFIENVFQCSQMSSELGTELNHKRSTNFCEMLEIYLIGLTTLILATEKTLYTLIYIYIYIYIPGIQRNGKGTERKRNDSFFFQKELNRTRNEAKFRSSSSVPSLLYMIWPFYIKIYI